MTMKKLELALPYAQLTSTKLKQLGAFWILVGLALSIAILNADNLLAILGLSNLGWLRLAKFVFFIAAGIAYVYVPYQVISTDDLGVRVIANKDGLGLPPALLGFRKPRWVSWTEVRKLEIRRDMSGRACLHIGFKPRGSYKLALTPLLNEDVEQLLLAFEVWTNNVIWSPKLIEFRDDLQNQNRGLTGWSYTQLWEAELGRHFNSTTFVPLEPGRMLRNGTIKIIRQLAFGGFSAVYIAEDSSIGTVVLKEAVVNDSEIESVKQKAMELFNREAILLAKLDHPQITKVTDHFVESERNYMVIEHIAGENLRQLVKRQGKQPESKVIDWAKQMAHILDYLHRQTPPIVHRDFTPDNIILRNDSTLVLIDFGAANEFLGAATGTLLGKPAYMSPEQVKGKALPSSDLYSLGGTLYFLLTGKDPEAITVSHPKRNGGDVTSEVDTFIAQLTALDVNDRPDSANEVINKLDTFSSALIHSSIKARSSTELGE